VDRNGGRRAEDRTLFGRIFQEGFYWWKEQAGMLAKTATVFSLLAGGAVQAASCGAAWAVAYGRWEDVPPRLRSLENWREDSIALVADSGFDRIDHLEDRVDQLEVRFGRVEASMGELSTALGRIEELAESNNCWLRVNAGEESRFNCSGGIE